MKKVDIVRAWKDEDYRLGLTEEELSNVPDSPAGTIELTDTDLEHVAGGKSEYLLTYGCCPNGGLTTRTCFCTVTCQCTEPCTQVDHFTCSYPACGP